MPRWSRRGGLLLLVAAGCASLASPPPKHPRPAATFDDDAVSAMARLLRLEDRREYDAATLAALAAHRRPMVRRRAALAAGRIGDSRAVPLLISALEDPVAAVRADAAFALGLVGDTAAASVQRLADHAWSAEEATPVRVEAVAALAKLRTDAARHAVERILAAGSKAPDEVVDEALLVIWRFGRRPGSGALIVMHAASPDPARRWRALYALMRLHDPVAVGAMVERLHDPEHRVRAYAARGLTAAVVDSAGARAQAVYALTEALADPHPHVRINAVRTLGGYHEPSRVGSILHLLSDPDSNVVIATVEALGSTGGKEATSALSSMLKATAVRTAIRGAALAALVRTAPEQGMQLAEPMANSERWLDRLYAARALAGVPSGLSAPLLRRLATDADPRVARSALDGLARALPDSLSTPPAVLVNGLASEDIGIRTASLNGLATRARAADLPLLLDAYDRARQDTTGNEAAIAAIDALGALSDKGVPVARSFFARFSRSPDPQVRAAVAQALGPGFWGPPLPIETGRSLVFYESVVRGLVLPDLADGRRPRARIRTARGTIVVDLFAADAPLTVRNFLSLARRGYFDHSRWHRVVPNFVIQDGDPRGDGSGGPGYAIRDEINRLRYGRGAVGMALSGPDTGGSQFFITHSPQPHLDGGYTIFGRVIAGMDVVDRVLQDDVILAVDVDGP